jgi:antitoxin CptB
MTTSPDVLHGGASSPISVSRESLAKLQWRCRRGMKELDLLLVRYLRNRYVTASSDERVAFGEFLELPDPDIARYLIAGDVPDDSRHAALCRLLVHPD